MGLMRIVDSTGDTQVRWSIDDPATLAEAEAIFRRLAASGSMAFARPEGRPAEEATLVRSFDPAAEEIIWVRAVQGG